MNDNDLTSAPTTVVPSDPHGQAALLLVESLIHGLCENATLSSSEAVDIARRAVEVQLEAADTAEDGVAVSLHRSHALLASIAGSLDADKAESPTPRPRME